VAALGGPRLHQAGARRRIAPRIDALATNPRPAGAKALQGRGHLLRLRIGEYRVVYQIDDQAGVVTIALVGHRRDVYRGID
jgi:mRNA interferase RelE/StbE